MKTKIITLALALSAAMSANAVPAQPGLWRTLKLADGTEVKVELRGDEFMRFWQDADGNRYTFNGKTLQPANMDELRQTSMSLRSAAGNIGNNILRSQNAKGGKRKVAYKGNKRCLILLAQFADKKFSMDDPKAFFTRVANEKGFSEGSFKGSVSDYFSAQSNGQFNITFDVVGPYTLGNMADYGGNDSNGNDKNPYGMVTSCCTKAFNEGTDFSPYDWDNDGTVEMVYVIYAGEGEATGGGDNTIWPHKSQLSQKLQVGNKYVSVYACSNELASKSSLSGIGTICHEFSHCLGYPDAYDILYKGFYGMGTWDLMCSGSYNGSQFIPAGYTAYEKWVAGWIEPVKLSANASYSDIKPVADGGEAYMYVNPKWEDEYYIIENRQRKGWDAGLAASGILVNHINYDKRIWAYNVPNTNYPGVNDFEHITIIPADGRKTNLTEYGDPWPFNGNSTLSKTSSPAATAQHATNSAGTKLMNISISNMDVKNGLASFTFTNFDNGSSQEGYIIHETFDKCQGKGGNDANGFTPPLLASDFAMGEFDSDVEGWEGSYLKGASLCARIGRTSASQAKITTPELKINGKASLTFKAAPYGTDGTHLTLSATDGATLGETSFTMAPNLWTNYSTTIEGNGTVQITFQGEKRWFLDEVYIQQDETDVKGITAVEKPADKRVFSLDGRYLGNDINKLGKGLYIVGGKKIMK